MVMVRKVIVMVLAAMVVTIKGMMFMCVMVVVAIIGMMVMCVAMITKMMIAMETLMFGGCTSAVDIVCGEVRGMFAIRYLFYSFFCFFVVSPRFDSIEQTTI